MQSTRSFKCRQQDGLTINVESAERWRKKTSGPANTGNAPQKSSSNVPITTPQTGHTFGCRTATFSPALPTASEANHVQSSSPPLNDPYNRRQRRYTAAESALASFAKQSSAEASPEEMQIRVLQNAAALLSQYADDARERSTQLKGLAAERDADAANTQVAQQQLWLEERRKSAMELEKKALNERLSNLSRSRLSQTTHDSLDEEERRKKNLSLFLASSTRQTPIRSQSLRYTQRLNLGEKASDLPAIHPPSFHHDQRYTSDELPHVAPVSRPMPSPQPATTPRSRIRDSVAMTFGVGVTADQLETVEEDEALSRENDDFDDDLSFQGDLASPIPSPASFTFGPSIHVESSSPSGLYEDEDADDDESDTDADWTDHTARHPYSMVSNDAEATPGKRVSHRVSVKDGLNRLPSYIALGMFDNVPQEQRRGSLATVDTSDGELLTPDSPGVADSLDTMDFGSMFDELSRSQITFTTDMFDTPSPPESPTIFKQPSMAQLRASHRHDTSLCFIPELEPTFSPAHEVEEVEERQSSPVRPRRPSLNILSSFSKTSRPNSPASTLQESASSSRPSTPFWLKEDKPKAASRKILHLPRLSIRSTSETLVDSPRSSFVSPMDRANLCVEPADRSARTPSPTPTVGRDKSKLKTLVLRRFGLSPS